MRKLRNLIHSTHTLFAFEAAGRLGSFTRAAEELHVSQPAISQSIRLLEGNLGVPLFSRGHRQVVLTEAGEKLFQDVSIALSHIERSVEQIDRRRMLKHVTLSCSTAFANYWMVPRLGEFRAANPEIDIRLETTDKDVDLALEGLSLGIRRGDGHWTGYRSAHIADEIIDAVASPGFAASLGAPLSVDALARQHLIHLEEPFRPRPSWREWFSAAGLEYRDRGTGLRLNDYALVLQAAMAGEGVALGWRHVTERLVHQGMLKAASGDSLVTGQGFHIIWSDARDLSVNAVAVRDWIVAQSEKMGSDSIQSQE